MLTTLLESQHQRTRNIQFQLVSVTLHAGLILAAVVGTQGVIDAAAPAEGDVVTPVYLPPKPKPVADCDLCVPAPRLPVLPAFPVVTHMPTDLPSFDLPIVFTGITDVIATPTAPGPIREVGMPYGTTVLTEAEVDVPARLRPGSGRPTYPETLRSAGLSGEVTAQFVIDSTGRADMLTVAIIASTHERFTEAVKRALEKARFTPAEFSGRKVRQVVRMPFVFSLQR